MTHSMRIAITLTLLCGAMLIAPACSKKTKGPDSDAVAKKALPGFADAAAAHFKRNGNKFIDTGVMVYCRPGKRIHKGKLAPVGYHARDAEARLSFCYNVSGNRKKVSLSVGTEEDESRWCITLDGTAGTIKRGAVAKKKGCMP